MKVTAIEAVDSVRTATTEEEREPRDVARQRRPPMVDRDARVRAAAKAKPVFGSRLHLFLPTERD